jgi:hypothetical protein
VFEAVYIENKDNPEECNRKLDQFSKEIVKEIFKDIEK